VIECLSNRLKTLGLTPCTDKRGGGRDPTEVKDFAGAENSGIGQTSPILGFR
jgi:hypothetical protein